MMPWVCRDVLICWLSGILRCGSPELWKEESVGFYIGDGALLMGGFSCRDWERLNWLHFNNESSEWRLWSEAIRCKNRERKIVIVF